MRMLRWECKSVCATVELVYSVRTWHTSHFLYENNKDDMSHTLLWFSLAFISWHHIKHIGTLLFSGALDFLKVLYSTHYYLPPSDSTLSENAGIEPGTVERLQWESNASSTRLDLIHSEGSTLYQHYSTLTFVSLIRFLGPILFIRYKLNNDQERRIR